MQLKAARVVSVAAGRLSPPKQLVNKSRCATCSVAAGVTAGKYAGNDAMKNRKRH
jgi:hypothetical protein